MIYVGVKTGGSGAFAICRGDETEARSFDPASFTKALELDITRKELDDFIQSRNPNLDADTVPVDVLRSIKLAIIAKQKGGKA